jgi:uncharacterized peroxidase-related enzyme
MPFIKLDQKYPGIVSLFMFDKGFAKHLSGMAQEIMRRPSTLSVGERELIAAYVSRINECQFCYRSHKACAEEFLDPKLVDDIVERGDYDSSLLSKKMLSLLFLANCIQAGPADHSGRWSMRYMHIERAKDHGATDQEIHDTVAIAAFFSLCNRYVDGLGTTFVPGEETEGGRGLAKYGYLMTIRRFFGDILPKMIRGWMQEANGG